MKFYENLASLDLNQLNPDWKFATKHGQSLLPGKSADQDIVQELCPCCLNMINKEIPSLTGNSKELQFLGFGFPLFYSFVRYCMLLLLILICSYSATSLFNDFQYSKAHCTTVDQYDSSHRLLASSSTSSSMDKQAIVCFTFMLEFSNINIYLSSLQILIRCVCFIMVLLTLLYIRQKQNTLNSYLDEKTTSVSDYSFILKNLPAQAGNCERVAKLLDQISIDNITGNTYQNTYEQLIPIPSLKQYYHKNHEEQILIKKQKQALQNKNTEELRQIQTEIKKCKDEIRQICIKTNESQQNDTLIFEKMIVIVNTQDQKSQIQTNYKALSKQKKIQIFGQEGNKVVLQEAPQPKQIIWKNINIPRKQKNIRVLVGWLVSILFILAFSVAIYFILLEKAQLLVLALQYHNKNPEQYEHLKNISVGLVYIALILIIFFNKFILGLFMHKVAEFQCHATTSGQQFSYCLKYALGMFFTTALMTIAVEAITFKNFFRHQYGVIEQQTIMFFLNSLLIPLIWLINPWFIVKRLKRIYYYGNKNLTQQQANTIMQQFPYDMGKRLAQVLKSMWFTFLYAALIPIGAFISLAGLFLYYWVDKYNLLRRSSIHHHVSGDLLKRGLKLLELVLIFMPLGSLLFDYQIRGTYSIAMIVQVIIAFIYLILPLDRIVEFLFQQKFTPQQQTFQSVNHQFTQTYRTLNPAQRGFYLADYLSVKISKCHKKMILGQFPKEAKLLKTSERQIQSMQSQQKIIQQVVTGQEKVSQII